MLSTMKKLLCLSLSSIFLASCGGSDTSSTTLTDNSPPVSSAPQPQPPAPAPQPAQITTFDENNIVSFDFTQRHQGDVVRRGQVLPRSFANVSGTIDYPPNNASLSGNITVSITVSDPDGIKNLFVGFAGVEQKILEVCSSSCGTSFHQTITAINPLKLGIDNASTQQLQLWVEDDAGNRVFTQSRTIQWQPVVIGGLAATRSAGNLNLQWSSVTNYFRYNVYISTDESLSVHNYDSLNLAHQSLALSSTSLNITSLDDETLFYALVSAVDGGGESAFSETLLINPLSGPPNEAPIANEDIFDLSEDESFSGNLISNDSDPDDEAVIIDTTVVVNVENGDLTINSDGTFSYTPPQNFFGVEQFTYRIADAEGLTDQATVTLNILEVNDPPVAQDNSYNIADSEQSLNVSAPGLLANDSDIDFDDFGQVRVDTTPVTPPDSGQLTLHADGAFDYQPEAGFNGEVSFAYRVIDGDNAASTASTTITVGGDNTPPEAVNDSYAINENSPLSTQNDNEPSLLANDSDADSSDTVSFDAVTTEPMHGTLTVLDDGHFSYVPNANFYGVDSFVYQISDNQGASAVASVTILVLPQNNPPVAVADNYQLDEDVTFSADAEQGVLANDSDSDGDTLRIDEVTQQPVHGQLQMSSDGSFTYTPESNFFGSDSFVYRVTDGKLFTDTTTVTLLVNNVNDNPQANNDSASTRQNTSVVIDVLVNDSDVDGDSLTVTQASANNGSTSISGNTIIYTPNQGFSGDDTITYTIEDGNGGSDTATVAMFVNDNNAPVAVDDNYSVAEDTQLTATAGSSDTPGVLDNDSDSDGDTLSVIEIINQPSLGSLSMAISGSFVYQPGSNNFGTDSFSYQVSDGNGGTDIATVTITIVGSNDAPTALDDTYTIRQDEEAVFTVLDNDFDVDGDAITITGAHGGSGEITVLDGTSIRYRPPAGFNGSDFFEYNIVDSNGATAFANVNITILPPNRPPQANDDEATTAEDQSIEIDILANDSDPDGDPLFVVSLRADHGRVTLTEQNRISYQPDANYHGPDKIVYTIADPSNERASATVHLQVTPVNDLPTAVDDAITTLVNIPVEFNPLINDSDIDGDPLRLTEATAQNGSVSMEGDNLLRYTPPADFEGSDTINYTIADNQGGSATAIVNVTINRDTRENHPPTARDDEAQLLEDTLVNINVLQNDDDVDGDSLTVTQATSIHGQTSVKSDNTIDFRPLPNFFGQGQIDYTINDGRGGQASAKVIVSVSNVNDAPVALNDQFEVEAGVAASLNVLANDTDVDGDSLRITQAQTTTGEIVIHDEVELIYTAPSDFSGNANIDYTVSDGQGATAQARAEVTVVPRVGPPDANDDVATTDEDTPVTINVLANDGGNSSQNPLRVSDLRPEHGTAVVNSDQSVTYTPERDFHGEATIGYTISNAKGSDTARIVVTVRSINDAPIAVDDSATVDEDSEVRINVIANDSDPEGDPIMVTTINSSSGSTANNEDGTITFRPEADFFGITSFDYTLSDGKANSTATVTVEVRPINDNPVARDDVYTIAEDTPSEFKPLENDTDVDNDPLRITAATSIGGTVTIEDDTQINYTPKANFVGTDTIAYTIADNHQGSDSGLITVTITPVNDPPGMADTQATVSENASVGDVVLNLAATDVDENETLTFAITGGNDDGVFAIDSGSGQITVANTENLDFDTTPSYALIVTVTDSGDLTAMATVTITVSESSGNVFPLADADFGNTNEDGLAASNAFAFDEDDSPQDAAMDADGNLVVVGGINNSDISVIRYNADGSVDHKFGVLGRYYLDFEGTEVARAVDIDTSGNIFVTGEYNNGTTTELFILKLTPTGQLDSTFGFGGMTFSVLNQTSLNVSDIIAHTDGSVLVGINLSDSITVLKFNSSGILQDTAAFDLPGSFDTLEVMAQQADGKVILAGHTADSTTFLYDFAVARINTATSLELDTSFNSTGTHTFDLGFGRSDMIFGIGLQSQEHIVLVGSITQSSGLFDVASAVLTPDGVLDSNFGDGGINIFDADGDGGSGSGQSYGRNVDIDANDNIYIGTQYSNGSTNHDFGVVKTSANGTLDSGFGNGGIAYITEDDNENFMVGTLLDSENRPLIITSTQGPRNQDFAVGRLTTSGVMDRTFLRNGHIQNNITASDDALYAGLTLKVGDNNGKYLMAGFTHATDTNKFDLIVARFNADGTLDNLFGENGYFYHYADNDATGTAGYQVYDMVELADGRIAMVGSFNGSQSFIFVISADGEIDEGFGSDGQLVTSSESAFAAFQAVATDSQGRIIAGGYQFLTTTDLYFVRVDGNGNFDSTFESNGELLIDVDENQYEGVNDIVMLSDDSFLVAGYHANKAFIAKILAEGALDTAGFNNGQGYQAVDMNSESTSNFDYLVDMEIGSNGIIYASGASSDSSSQGSSLKQILMSLNADGTLNTDFAGQGFATYEFGKGDGQHSLALDANNNLLLTGTVDNSAENGTDIYLARVTPSGEQDSTFNNGSSVNYSNSANDFSNWITVLDDGRILLAGYTSSDDVTEKFWFMMMLELVDPCVETLVNNNAGQKYDLQLAHAQRLCR